MRSIEQRNKLEMEMLKVMSPTAKRNFGRTGLDALRRQIVGLSH